MKLLGLSDWQPCIFLKVALPKIHPLMGVFLSHVSCSLLFVVLLCILVLAAGLDFWRWKEFRRYFSDFYDTKSLNNNINLILRRGQLRLLRVRDFLNTEYCLRVNQRHFGGKTWLPPSFNYELQRECLNVVVAKTLKAMLHGTIRNDDF